jgi:hypothetical protein
MSTNRLITVQLWSWIALVLFMVLPPSAASADCKGEWDVSGNWTITQDNGITAAFELREVKYNNGLFGWWQVYAGSAAFSAAGSDPMVAAPESQKGTVEGGFHSEYEFELTVKWNSGDVGIYTGDVDSEGNVAGFTERENARGPGTGAKWHGDGQAKCKPRPAVPCGPTFVWRDNFQGDTWCVYSDQTHRLANGTCIPGYVWRDRSDGDTVCVKPDERHRLANGTCSPGYVWRDTFNGDTVCVTPEQRDAAKAQKRRDELGEVPNHPGAAGMSH